jgi:hypothetical protein
MLQIHCRWGPIKDLSFKGVAFKHQVGQSEGNRKYQFQCKDR